MTRNNPVKARSAALGGCGLFLVVGVYIVIWKLTGVGFVCPINFLTGWHCPGCGLTRMLAALLRLDLYQAFRFNPLLFVLLPAAIVLFVESRIARSQDRQPWVDKIPIACWIIVIVVLLIYGVIRNLPWFSFLAPTAV